MQSRLRSLTRAEVGLGVSDISPELQRIKLLPARRCPLRAHVSRAESSETAGVRDLLQRDRKLRGVSADELETPRKGQDEAVSSKDSDSSSAPAGAQAVAARTQSLESGQAEKLSQTGDGPRSSSAAILAGVEELRKQNPSAAVELFQQALELPGKGAFRMQGSPREYSCASEGEEIAALYNLACAYAALGQSEAALAALEGAFDAGFQDYNTCRSDPDLRGLPATRLETLINERQGLSKGGGFWNPLQKLWKGKG